MRRTIAAHNGQILDEDFAADVTLTARFAVDHFSAFQASLRELSSGQWEAEIVETDEATIMPVGTFGTAGET